MTLLADLLYKAWWLLTSPLRAIRWAWRKITPETARKVRDLSIIIVVVISIYNVRLQREASAVNRRIFRGYEQVLQKIEDQTSPEAQQRQQNLIDLIIDRVDCRNQAALQRTIDVLVERDVLEPGDVQAITEACQRLIVDETLEDEGADGN